MIDENTETTCCVVFDVMPHFVHANRDATVCLKDICFRGKKEISFMHTIKVFVERASHGGVQ